MKFYTTTKDIAHLSADAVVCFAYQGEKEPVYIKQFHVKEEGFTPIVNGKQILKMEASSSGYSPNYFKVKAGILVRWEIKDIGTSGCTNAVISRSLFDGPINLTPGQTSIKEFTPIKPGKYKFSCWMGMVSGLIEVVDNKGTSINSFSNVSNEENSPAFIPSGASGCSCGCGVNK